MSVTYVGAFCVGGEVPILVYSADQESVKLLEGQGEAPRDPKAIAWYKEHGIPDGDVKSAAVPGTIDAIVTLLKLYGTKSFEEVVQPTLVILDAGGPSRHIDTGSGPRIETGMNWQADMAVTFRKLVESEKAAKGTRQQKLQAVSDRFYRGDIAEALEAWYIEKGGFLRKADLAAHKTPVVDPLKTTYRGYTVYKAGPLTQGPLSLTDAAPAGKLRSEEDGFKLCGLHPRPASAGAVPERRIGQRQSLRFNHNTTDVYMQEIPESVQATINSIHAELKAKPQVGAAG